MPFGRTIITTSRINPTRVCADNNPAYKPGGVTLDITTIPAASGSDITLPDGSVIAAGAQYLRYGQVLTKMGTSEAQTITISGTPTGGTFTLTLPAVGLDLAQTTAAIAYNATAATVAAALNALQRIASAGGVSASGGALPGSAVTVTFPASMGDAPQLTSTNSLTGGSSPAIAHATTTAGLASNGKFGPYDPSATDGRQTLTRGDAFILNETWVYNPAGSSFAGLGGTDTIGGVFNAGLCWFDRLLQSGAASASLALGPTKANLETLFPNIYYVKN